jgi:hypothetical protein
VVADLQKQVAEMAEDNNNLQQSLANVRATHARTIADLEANHARELAALRAKLAAAEERAETYRKLSDSRYGLTSSEAGMSFAEVE